MDLDLTAGILTCVNFWNPCSRVNLMVQVILSWLPGYFYDRGSLRSTGSAIPPTMHMRNDGEIMVYVRPFFRCGPTVGLFLKMSGIEAAIKRGETQQMKKGTPHTGIPLITSPHTGLLAPRDQTTLGTSSVQGHSSPYVNPSIDSTRSFRYACTDSACQPASVIKASPMALRASVWRSVQSSLT